MSKSSARDLINASKPLTRKLSRTNATTPIDYRSLDRSSFSEEVDTARVDLLKIFLKGPKHRPVSMQDWYAPSGPSVSLKIFSLYSKKKSTDLDASSLDSDVPLDTSLGESIRLKNPDDSEIPQYNTNLEMGQFDCNAHCFLKLKFGHQLLFSLDVTPKEGNKRDHVIFEGQVEIPSVTRHRRRVKRESFQETEIDLDDEDDDYQRNLGKKSTENMQKVQKNIDEEGVLQGDGVDPMKDDSIQIEDLGKKKEKIKPIDDGFIILPLHHNSKQKKLDNWYTDISEVHEKAQGWVLMKVTYIDEHQFDNSVKDFLTEVSDTFLEQEKSKIALRFAFSRVPMGEEFFSILEHFDSKVPPDQKRQFEQWAFMNAHYYDYMNVFKFFLERSLEPLRTAFLAYEFSSTRGRESKNDAEQDIYGSSNRHHWEYHTAAIAKEISLMLDLLTGIQYNWGFNDFCNSDQTLKFVSADSALDGAVEDIVEAKIDEVTVHPIIDCHVTAGLVKRQKHTFFPISPIQLFGCHVFCYFILTVTFLVLLGFNSTASNTYQYEWSQYLEGVFIGDSSTMEFDSISSEEDFYVWLEQVLLTSIISDSKIRGLYLAHPEIIVRQFRAKPVECMVPQFQSCYGEIRDSSTMERAPVWKDTPFLETPGLPALRGVNGFWYPPSGYTTFFDDNFTNSQNKIQILKSIDWFDNGTRAVFVSVYLGLGNSLMFARADYLVEQMHVGAFKVQRAINTIDFSDPSPTLLGLCIFVIIVLTGHVIQEITEFIFNYISNRRKRSPWLHSPFSKYPEDKSPFAHRVEEIWAYISPYVTDTRNKLDLVVIISLIVYLCLFLDISLHDFLVIPISPSDFENSYNKILIANIFGTIGVVCLLVRLLYYTIAIKSTSTFLLGLESMITVSVQYLLVFTCFIVGFGAGFSILYGTHSPTYNGLREYFSATINGFVGYDNSVTNTMFQPYAFYWFGDALLIIYMLISVIMLVNMLIALMGNEFQRLNDKNVIYVKMIQFRGELLYNIRRSLFPPPFNILHLLLILCVGKFIRLTPPEWEAPKKKIYNIANLLLREMYHKFKTHTETNEQEVYVAEDDDNTVRQKDMENYSKVKPFIKKFFEDLENFSFGKRNKRN